LNNADALAVRRTEALQASYDGARRGHGRKTFDSIGSPLPGRDNIVITRSPEWSRPDCRIGSLARERARRRSTRTATRSLIGGAQIYALGSALRATPSHDRDRADFEGDALLPESSARKWREVSRERRARAAWTGSTTRFVEYERSACLDHAPRIQQPGIR